MKGEVEKKASSALAPNDAIKENQVQIVESSAASAAAGAPAPAAPLAGAAAAAAPNPAAPAPAPAPPAPARARQPFTQLSQLESDMAIARALQEQERAYMLLRSGGNYNVDEDDDEESEEDGEDGEPQSASVIDGSNYENDEDFARALQEAEYTTVRMMAFAGIQDAAERNEEQEEDEDEGEEGEAEDEDVEANDDDDDDEEDGEEDEEEEENEDDQSDDESQDMWEDVDPDNMTYEELIALGEAVGTESKGLATNLIDELPVSSYKRDQIESSSTSSDHEQCVICRHDYEEEEMLLTLPCKHKYHSECIRQWLQINKVCPVCSAGVDGS